MTLPQWMAMTISYQNTHTTTCNNDIPTVDGYDNGLPKHHTTTYNNDIPTVDGYDNGLLKHPYNNMQQ